MKYFFIPVLSVCILPLFAQKDKADKSIEKARKDLLENNLAAAVKDYQKAIEYDPQRIDARLGLFNLYDQFMDGDQAIQQLQALLKLNVSGRSALLYNLTKSAIFYGNYLVALQAAHDYLSGNAKDSTSRSSVQHWQDQAQYALSHLKDSFQIKFNSMTRINTSVPEYLPSIDALNKQLVFTRRTQGNEDLYIYSFEKDTVTSWSQNTPMNEGAHTISGDGKTIVFTRCGSQDGYGNCDLYISELTKGTWSKPINMGPRINTQYWESQPCLSVTGRSLYFVSDRPGGKGGYDIWISNKVGNNWARPYQAGDSINTKWNENSPVLHFDQRTLYFRSDGWPGFGSYDLFVSYKNKLNKWGSPINLGYPINDFKDQGALTVARNGLDAYITDQTISSRNELIESNIRSVKLPYGLKATECALMQGITVVDSIQSTQHRNKQEAHTFPPKLSQVRIMVYADSSELAVDSLYSDQDGEFSILLPEGKTYQINYSKPGFTFVSERIKLPMPPMRLRNYVIVLRPLLTIDTAQHIILRNVLFETNQAVLLKDSYVELDQLIYFLNENKGIKCSIEGHTDNVGNDADNLTLSRSRAKAVFDYLISKGISVERLNYSGFGKSKPISSNDTDTGRANNRRVEIKLSK